VRNSTFSLDIKIARCLFLGGRVYALLASLGYVLPGRAQKEGETGYEASGVAAISWLKHLDA
jgi:hypothetical protein